MKHEFFIAGVQFRPRIDIVKAMESLKVGQQLILEPEPTNKYDPNAVKITHNAFHLGYVPAKISSSVSAALEVFDDVTCTLLEVNKDDRIWKRFKVVIEGGN